MAMNPFMGMDDPSRRIGGPAPVPGFGNPRQPSPWFGIGQPKPPSISGKSTPWSSPPPSTYRAESQSLFSYAEPFQTKRLGQEYAQMVGGQTEELRKQQAAREATLRSFTPEFQSRYGQQTEMPEEYKTAMAGAAPTLGAIPSYKDFALSKGFYQQGRDFVTNAAPGVRQRLGYVQDPTTKQWMTSEQARQQEQQMLAELPPYMREQYIRDMFEKRRQERQSRGVGSGYRVMST